MNPSALRSIIYAQVCLYGGLLIAIALKPVGLRVNSGISYYGIYAKTITPYLVALVGSSLCCWQAAEDITDREFNPLRLGLKTFAVLVIIIASTPYALNSFTDRAHVTAGSLLFALQLVLSGWLIVKSHCDQTLLALGIIELGAGIACAIYLSPRQGFLLQCQVIFQTAFAALLICFMKRRTARPRASTLA